MATMADIAERAGVALSTVSYVLSGKRSVSEETRQRVFRAIAELDYQPHAFARGLASRRTRTIALLYPSPENGYSEIGLEFVMRAANAATQHGYAFLLWTAPDEENEMLQLIQQSRVDGLILMEIKLHDSRVALLKERGYPFSMIGHCEDNDGISFVDFDFDHAAYTAVAHLAALGHRRIALLNHSHALIKAGYGPAVRSLQGFERAVHDHGLSGFAVACEASPEYSQAIIQSLLAEYADFSAAVLVGESMLAGVQRALYAARLRMPDDFSVVGLLSAHVSQMVTPPLTSVDFPVAEMGRIGAESLINYLEGTVTTPVQQLLRSELVVRQSSGPYRQRGG